MPVFTGSGTVQRRSSGGGGGGGIIGDITGGIESAVHDVATPFLSVPGDIGTTLTHVIPGVAYAAEHPIAAVKQIPGQLEHDFTPTNLYHHPFFAAMDLLQFAPTPFAVGARVAEVGRVASALGEEAATRGAEAGIEGAEAGTDAASAAANTQSPARQLFNAAAFGPVPKERIIKLGNWNQPGLDDSRNPLIMQGQKLLDQLHENNPTAHIPGLWKSQASRSLQAAKATFTADKGLRNVDSNLLVRKFGKSTNGEHEAIRLVAEGVLPEDQEAFIRNEVIPHVRGGELKKANEWLQATEDSKQYLEPYDYTSKPTMRTVEPTEGEFTTTPGEVKEIPIPNKRFLTEHFKVNPALGDSIKAGGKVSLSAGSYDRMLADAQRLTTEGSTAQLRKSAGAAAGRLEKAGRPADATSVPTQAYKYMAHEGGTYTLPRIKDEFPHLQEYERQARLVSNRRTTDLLKNNAISVSDAETRALAPKNLKEGHGIIPNIAAMKRDLTAARNFGHVAHARDLEKEIAYWEGKRGEAGGQLAMDIPEDGRPDPITDPDLASQLFRIPQIPTARQAISDFRKAWRGGKPQVPSSLNHAYEGIMERHGGGDPNVARVLAESYQESARFLYLTKLRKQILAAGQPTPEGIDPNYATPLVEDYWRGNLPPGFNFPSKAMLQGHLQGNEAEAAGRWYESIRPYLMEPSAALRWAQAHDPTGGTFRTEADLYNHTIPGVVWIDKRMLGGLDKQNPLFQMTSSPVIRRGLKFTDALNEIQKAALLYLKPAYLVPNMLGNAALALVHQGFLAPYNLGRSFRMLFTGKGVDEEVRSYVQSAVGNGLTGSFKTSPTVFNAISRGSNWIASQYGKIIDDPFRFSAFLHEANVAGFSTADDLKRLVTDPDLENKLYEVTIRANDALINYERLGPGEQAILRRLIFFYPWVKGSARYSYQLAINHPFVAGTQSGLSRQGEAWQARTLGPLPDYLEGVIPMGGGSAVSNPSSAAIEQQTGDIVNAFVNTFKGNPNPDIQLLQGLAPVDAGLLTATTGHTTMPVPASEPYYQRALGEAFGGWPIAQLIQNASAGFPARPNRLYPHDTALTDLSKFLLLGGGTRRQINRATANRQARKQDRPTGYQT